MSELSELNKTIITLNDLWPLLEDEEKEAILELRNALNDKASELSHKTLLEGASELNEAICQLTLAAQAAKDTRESINNVTARVIKVADTIEKTTSAVNKVASYIALL